MTKSSFTSPGEQAFYSFAARHHLTVPHKSQWRMCEEQYGHIQGLPRTYGMLRATDGVLCFVEFADGTLFLGHLDSFIRERKEQVRAQPRQSRAHKDLMALLTAE